MDPRWYQIGSLAALLAYGMLRLDFDIGAAQAAVTLASALGIQYVCTRVWRLLVVDPKSALISGLSLCLLLRTNDVALAAVAAAIAVGSKFLLRVRGKHLFNPTNFGLVAMLATTDAVWVSPGQWGSVAVLAFLFVCLGGLVVNRAARSDIAIGFLVFYAAMLFGRSAWLGEPAAIPLHRLENGALLLFAFFMISDPKTTPDSRAGRLIFAALVTAGAWYVQFKLFRTNGLLWSLALFSFAVPLIDLLLPGPRYEWARKPRPEVAMTRARLATLATIVFVAAAAQPAFAFCGFYVARADSKLFNRASQVVLVRDGDRTVLTMSNDFRGEPKEFAVVVPVPTFIEREQIHVGERALVDHLDAFTAPRLVEYFDDDPCRRVYPTAAAESSMRRGGVGGGAYSAKSLGVKIEAQYTVGEYDILILSAEQSGGLATWLKQNGYRIPDGAEDVLGSYIKQNMRFFVARVNIKEQARLGFTYLRPLQVAYESPKFMLPIRLGTVNADGPQDLIVFALTRKGRVETTNYRTVKLPTGMDLPVFVKQKFPDFYRDMFAEQVRKESMSAVFLEYAWDMAWCDPCAADPLSKEQLRKLGVFWLDDSPQRVDRFGMPPRPIRPPSSAPDVYVTRLHVRYDRKTFPEDLVFQQTGNRDNFQGRYVLHHPWTGNPSCGAAEDYRRTLNERREKEAQNLAMLTGWNIADIRKQMGVSAKGPEPGDEKWWRRIWK
jgi:hypothetical protein